MCQCRGLTTSVLCAAAIGGVVLLAGFASSQQGGSSGEPSRLPPGERIPGPQAPDTEAGVPVSPEIADHMQEGTLAPEHRWLAERAGKWTVEGRFWAGPGEPMTTTGTATYSMILGDRFLRQEMQSEFMGEPFKGIGTTGFNIATRKFETTWIDSTSTAMMYGTGTRGDDERVLTFHFDMYDPHTKQHMKVRAVETMTDAEHFTFAMFGPGPDGAEMKFMELVYTRAK